MSRRSERAVAVAVGAAWALSGCQGVTRHLTDSSSPCFQVLPAAGAALEGQGRYVSVVRLRGARAAQVLLSSGRGAPGSSAGSSTSGPGTSAALPGRDACAVVYRGVFAAARVQHHVGPAATGSYAVVFVDLRSRLVRAVVLTDSLPDPLRRR